MRRVRHQCSLPKLSLKSSQIWCIRTDLTRCKKDSNQCPCIGCIDKSIGLRERCQCRLELITLKEKSLETESDLEECPHSQLT